MDMKVFNHLSPEYLAIEIPHNNGAYYYCKEINDRIIPKIKTKRNWVLLNVPGCCYDNSIVFIHNNKNPERYFWMKDYKNLILVCSNYKTLTYMIEMFPQFHCIYIPLSVDVEYVKQFKAKRKTRKIAYFGRLEKFPEEWDEGEGIDQIYSNDREDLLKQVAKYKTVYAIGRCAIEAKILGCEVLPHPGEYEKIGFKVIDNEEIIPELQRLLNEIDGVN